MFFEKTLVGFESLWGNCPRVSGDHRLVQHLHSSEPFADLATTASLEQALNEIDSLSAAAAQEVLQRHTPTLTDDEEQEHSDQEDNEEEEEEEEEEIGAQQNSSASHAQHARDGNQRTIGSDDSSQPTLRSHLLSILKHTDFSSTVRPCVCLGVRAYACVHFAAFAAFAVFAAFAAVDEDAAVLVTGSTGGGRPGSRAVFACVCGAQRAGRSLASVCCCKQHCAAENREKIQATRAWAQHQTREG